MAPRDPAPDPARRVPALVAVSGACGLVYQSLWLRSFGLVFGNTTDAVALVLATFMGGLALGSALAARRPCRLPLRAYARVEMGIGVAALLSVPLLRALPGAYASVAGRLGLEGASDLALRALAAGAILLPATVLMGATVPIAVGALARRGGGLPASFGRLYLANTLGGAAGVALGPFVLLPALGVSGTLVAAAVGNLLVGAAARRFSLEERATSAATAAGSVPERVDASLPVVLLRVLAFASGAFAFGIEVVWTRSFALVIGSSVYAFSLMLLAVLLGIAAGTVVHERMRQRFARRGAWIGALLAAAGLAAVAGAVAMGQLPALSFALMKGMPVSFGAHQAASFALCLALMLPVTVPLGLTFPLLAAEAAGAPQAAAGRLYAWNTAGALAGALAGGFLLVPLLGLQSSFVALGGLAAAAGTAAIVWSRPTPLVGRLAAVVVVALAAVFTAPRFRIWDPLLMTAGIYKYGLEWRERAGFDLAQDLRAERELVFYEEGREAVVAVAQRPGSTRRFLSVNGKTDAGSGAEDVLTQRFIAHVPLLLHADPRRVLVVGWGAGATAASAALYPVERLECVEIEPATFRAAPLFDALSGAVRRDPRFRIVFRDGRSHLLRAEPVWDVIVSEPSNPWISGVSNLFTREFYAVARDRLAPGGVFGQWFQYYNLDPADVKVELATFASVFPHATLWLVPPLTGGGAGSLTADLVLVGSREPHALDFERVRRAFAGAVGEDLRATGVVRDEVALVAAWAMDRPALLRFSADAAFPRGTPLNTDDQPWIELRAPRRNVVPPAEVARIARDLYVALGESAAGQEPPVRGPAEPAEAARLARALAERYQEVLLPSRALGAARRAASLEPGDARGLELLGGLLLDGRDFPEAEAAHRKLLALRPADVDAWLRLGAIMARQSKWTAARDAFRRALSIDARAPVDAALLDYVEQQAAARGATSR
jgi:spermidine synthase